MSNCYNENYIKEAAYYLWQNAGCPSGQDDKFWSLAVEQYYNYSCSSSSSKKSCCKSTCSTSSSSSKKTTSSRSSKTSSKTSSKK